MLISERFCAGFALAATIARDRDAALASRGLCAEIAPRLLQTVQALAALSKQARRDRVRALLQPQRPSWPSAPNGPLRAYTLLAQGERAHTLPAWLRAGTTPWPRAGYQPAPELLTMLRQSAAGPAL